MKLYTKILSLGVSAVVLGACASAPPPPPPPPPTPVAQPKEVKPVDQLDAANKLFAKGEFEKAKESYALVLQKKPDDVAALYNRGVAAHRLGQLDEAKKDYEAVLAKEPTALDAALNLGAVLKEKGDLKGAISLYEKAAKGDEFNSKLLNNLSALYRHDGKHKQAIAMLRKLLKRDKDNVDAYKNLALVYYDQKKYKLAQTITENALRMAKEQKKVEPDIYVNLGMIHMATGEKGAALAAFKKAAELDPNHVIANYNIGALALGHRDYDLAAKTYAVVAKARPNDYEIHASLGYALQGQQKYEDAAKALQRAREIKLQHATANADQAKAEDEQMVLQLMVISQASEKWDEAMKWADEYMKLTSTTCGEENFEGFCGRLMGIKTMIEMAKQPAPAPEEEKKVNTQGVEIFQDGPAEGDDAAAPTAEGGEAGAEGAPAEGAPAEGASAEAAAEGGADAEGAPGAEGAAKGAENP